MIELHALTPDDWRLWRDLRLAALAEAPHAFASRVEDWQGDGDREERWRCRLAMPGSHNLIAKIDLHPVGMASGVPTDDPAVCELIAMWVCPEARGKGVGDALIGGVTDWARATGAAHLRLAVYDHNRAAANLYRRNGFTEIATLGTGGPDDERFMAKPLHDPA